MAVRLALPEPRAIGWKMLFVDDGFRGQGVGTALLDFAVRELGVTGLDVNEQNPQAVSFYSHRGFEVVGRSDFDPAGRPYPLLHMRRIGSRR